MTKLCDCRCQSCGDYFDARGGIRYPAGGALEPDAGILCPTCFDEGETVIAVHIFKPDGAETTYELGYYRATEGRRSASREEWEFDTCDIPTGWTRRWHATDDWHGYYIIDAPDDWSLVELTGDELAAFGAKLRKVCGDYCRSCARVTSRTSNIFSTGGDWYIEAPQEVAEQLVRDYVR